MQLERDIMKKFIDYLKEHGYPENSLAMEYKIGNTNFRADLVVIDPTTNIPIMIFELKSKKTKPAIEQGKIQLLNYLKELPDGSIPAYVVFPNENEPYFEVYNIFKPYDNEKQNDIYNPDYKSIKNAVLSQKVNNKEKEKEKTIDQFKVVCWGLSILILIFLVIKTAFNIHVKTIDMTLIASAIVLVLMPFASKLKFLGIEFERLSNAKNKQS